MGRSRSEDPGTTCPAALLSDHPKLVATARPSFLTTRQGVAGASENPPVAYVWLALAKKYGIKEGDKRSKDVWVDMTASEREETRRLIKDVRNVPCEWGAVFRK
jgi:hypothetical protein